ncbi:hypothetical protein FORC73_1933 [Vibrio cholerae]|nr:hypothetical protein FORC73_1933 [Vibrio cholerae]
MKCLVVITLLIKLCGEEELIQLKVHQANFPLILITYYFIVSRVTSNLTFSTNLMVMDMKSVLNMKMNLVNIDGK